MNETALLCEGMKKSFGSVRALTNATISVKKGEIRAILGGNGSGKSTLAKILGGVVRADQGTVQLLGKPLTIRSPRDAKRHGIMMTSQELSLFTNHTVETNLFISQLPRKWRIFTDRKQVKEKGEQVLAELRLTHLLGKKVSALAPNEQYMVEFAKAMVQNPKILIVDEITSALYREEVDLIKQMLFRLKKEGVAILFISHRMSEIYSICDTVTVMRNGETVATVGVREKSQDELLSLMSGQEIMEISQLHAEEIAVEDDRPDLVTATVNLPKFNTKFDVRIQKGEFVGIAGLQGHGQADLVRMLYGLMGNIQLRFEKATVTVSSPRQAVEQGIAFISGDREKEGVFSIRSLRENLTSVSSLVLGQKGINTSQVLQAHGVKFKDVRQEIQTLSGGNQQKVVIGRWIITQPKLLLADDPTKGIDVQARRDVHRMLCQLIHQGSSVVMVSSDDEELVQLAHMAKVARIFIMYEGRIVRILKGADITTEKIISASIPRGA